MHNSQLMQFHGVVGAVVPPIAAVLAGLTSFLVSPGFTVIGLLGTLALLPVSLALGIGLSFGVLPHLIAAMTVGRARAVVFAGYCGAWLGALSIAPVVFWIVSSVASVAWRSPVPNLVEMLTPVWLVCAPSTLIATVATALLIPVTVLRTSRRSVPSSAPPAN